MEMISTQQHNQLLLAAVPKGARLYNANEVMHTNPNRHEKMMGKPALPARASRLN
jgi:hypothetical protein